MQQKQKEENKDLSLFELNLETWRQLWRVLELSDILLIIVDVRYSVRSFTDLYGNRSISLHYFFEWIKDEVQNQI